MSIATVKIAHVICFSNHKGGVGKTCSVCNTGAGLSLKGKKVLLVDLDPQANLTMSFGLKGVTPNIYRALVGDCKLSEAVHSVSKNLDVIPSHLDLSGAEVELSSEPGREFLLRALLDDIKSKYDFILIDCAPSLGLLTLNALTASTDVFIPMQPQYYALEGLTKLQEIIYKVRRLLNKQLKIGGVIITQYDGRKILNREIVNSIQAHFKGVLFKTYIRDNVSLAEAPAKDQDIFQYNPKSYGALDYGKLCSEILRKYKLRK